MSSVASNSHLRFEERRKAILSMDIESDWGGRCPVEGRGLYGIRCGLPKALDILKKGGCSATCFVSAELAERNPDIVPLITSFGHEVASHGYHHQNYRALSRHSLRYQVEKSKDVLEAQSGRPVLGFRAPQFGLSPYLFEVLRDVGYYYDSSVVIGRLPNRYRFNHAVLEKARQCRIVEVPVQTLPIVGFPLGLLWINAIGFTLAIPFIRILSQKSSLPVVSYCHPFDFLALKEQPCSNGMKLNTLVRAWYRWRSTSVASTFEKWVDHISRCYIAITMSEFAGAVEP